MPKETLAAYSVLVSCKNCGHESRIIIPKRQLITEQPCPVCGCKTLQKTPFSVPGVPA